MEKRLGLLLAGTALMLVVGTLLRPKAESPPSPPADASAVPEQEAATPAPMAPAPPVFASPADAEVGEVDGIPSGTPVPPGGLPIEDGRVLEVRVVDEVTGRVIDGVPCRVVGRGGPWSQQPRREGRYSSLDVPWVDVEVDPPGWYGALRPYRWEGPIAASVMRHRLDLPVFPARTTGLRVEDTSGNAVGGVRATSVRALGVDEWFGGRGRTSVTARGAATSSDGQLTLTGVPRIPFGRVAIEAGIERRTSRDWLIGTMKDVRLDAPAGAPVLALVVAPGDRDRSFVSGVTSGFGCGRQEAPGPTVSLSLRVLRRDGSPASFVNLSAPFATGETGADGCARLDGVPVGRCDVVASAHGFLPTVVSADAGSGAEVVIRESEPRRVRVTVVDGAGAPLSAARVRCWCYDTPGASGESVSVYSSVAQLAAGVETLAPMTGGDGSVTLLVPAGRISYVASLGSAHAKLESSDESVRIVLAADEK